MKLAVQYRSLDALVPYVRNARTHSDAQIAEIAGSIREFGWTNPILVDEAGNVIAGHGRLLAARQLALDTVPTIELRGLSDAKRRALVLADNRIALNAGWDVETLKIELADLQEDGFALDGLGFSAAELDAYLPSDVMDVSDAAGTVQGRAADNLSWDMQQLSWVKKKVPITRDEFAALEAAYKNHCSTTGGKFGFAAAMLRGDLAATGEAE